MSSIAGNKFWIFTSLRPFAQYLTSILSLDLPNSPGWFPHLLVRRLHQHHTHNTQEQGFEYQWPGSRIHTF